MIPQKKFKKELLKVTTFMFGAFLGILSMTIYVKYNQNLSVIMKIMISVITSLYFVSIVFLTYKFIEIHKKMKKGIEE